MFHWMLENTLIALALSVAAIPVCLLLRSRPAVCHLLWLVILVRLVLPPVPLESAAAVTEFAGRAADQLPTLAGLRDVLDLGGVRLAGYLLWIAGGLALLTVQLRRCRQLQRVVSSAPPAPASLCRTVAYMAKVLGVNEPGVRMLDGLGSPAMWSFGRPVFLWPSVDGRARSNRCIKGLVAHELAHIRRRDHLVAWFEVAAMAVCWWNPVFWFVRRRLRLHAEEACDAWTVWALPESRRAYADALIDVADRPMEGASKAPVRGAGGSGPWAFRRRLGLIMQRHVSHRASPLAAGLAMVAAVVLLPGAFATAPDAPGKLIAQDLDARRDHPETTAPSDIPARLLAAIEAEQLRWSAYELSRDRRWEEAEAVYRDIVEEDAPDNGWALHRLGRALLAQGRDAEALRVFERQLATGVAQTAALASIASIPAAGGDQPDELVQAAQHAVSLMKEGGAAIDAREWNQAITAFRALRTRFPQLGRAAHLLAYALIGNGSHEEALRVCSEQIELGYAVPTALYNTACAHARMGSLDESMDALQSAIDSGFDMWELLAEDPDLEPLRITPRMQELLAGIQGRETLRSAATRARDSGDWWAAVDGWRALVDHAPPGGKEHLYLAESLLMAGAPDAAAAVLEQFVLHASEQMNEALFQLARSHAMTGEADRALAYLEGAVRTGFADLERMKSDQLLAGLRVTHRFDRTLQEVEQRRRMERSKPETTEA